jgi:2-oxoglutarate dehydrogenase complex dehydrogenase (E1) component-like enzyme
MDYRMTETLKNKKWNSVEEVHEYLKEMYCGSVGVEFEHVVNEEERLWCYENYEKAMQEELTPGEKVKAMQLLLRTECMEHVM